MFILAGDDPEIPNGDGLFLKYCKESLFNSELLEAASAYAAKRKDFTPKTPQNLAAVQAIAGHITSLSAFVTLNEKGEKVPYFSPNESDFYRRLLSHNPQNPQGLIRFLQNIHPQTEFLTKQDSWLTGLHLLTAVRVLNANPALPKKKLKEYLYSRANKNKKAPRPLDRLREEVVLGMESPAVLALRKNLGQEEKIAQVQRDRLTVQLLQGEEGNSVKGWLNLTLEQKVRWAERSKYNESVCKIIVTDRGFFDKFNQSTYQKNHPRYETWPHSENQSLDLKEMLTTESADKPGARFFKAGFAMHQAIESEEGGLFKLYGTKVESYITKTFGRTARRGPYDQTRCELVVANPRFWKHLAIAPAKKGWFGIGERPQQLVDDEEMDLAKEKSSLYRSHLC